MSSGPGRVQRHALEILSREPGKMWNAFDIAAEVYEIGEDRDGEWIIPDAPAVAVRRALLDLRKQGKAECSNRATTTVAVTGGWRVMSQTNRGGGVRGKRRRNERKATPRPCRGEGPALPQKWPLVRPGGGPPDRTRS
jgi:hypothetical protein